MLVACLSPWRALPDVGTGAGALELEAFLSSATYDDDGVPDVSRAVVLQRQTLRGRLDLGVGERLALRLHAPMIRAVAIDAATADAKSVVAMGDVGAGLGLLVVDDALQVVIRADVTAPLYTAQPSRQGRQPDDDGAPGPLPAVGDGQADASASVVVGAAFPFDGFFWGELGYRLRTGGITDAVFGRGVLSAAALGGRLWPRWRHAFAFSLDAASDRPEVIGQSVAETGPGVAVRLDDVADGLSLEIDAVVRVRGRNAAGGTAMMTGIMYVF